MNYSYYPYTYVYSQPYNPYLWNYRNESYTSYNETSFARQTYEQTYAQQNPNQRPNATYWRNMGSRVSQRNVIERPQQFEPVRSEHFERGYQNQRYQANTTCEYQPQNKTGKQFCNISKGDLNKTSNGNEKIPEVNKKALLKTPESKSLPIKESQEVKSIVATKTEKSEPVEAKETPEPPHGISKEGNDKPNPIKHLRLILRSSENKRTTDATDSISKVPRLTYVHLSPNTHSSEPETNLNKTTEPINCIKSQLEPTLSEQAKLLPHNPSVNISSDQTTNISPLKLFIEPIESTNTGDIRLKSANQATIHLHTSCDITVQDLHVDNSAATTISQVSTTTEKQQVQDVGNLTSEVAVFSKQPDSTPTESNSEPPAVSGVNDSENSHGVVASLPEINPIEERPVLPGNHVAEVNNVASMNTNPQGLCCPSIPYDPMKIACEVKKRIEKDAELLRNPNKVKRAEEFRGYFKRKKRVSLLRCLDPNIELPKIEYAPGARYKSIEYAKKLFINRCKTRNLFSFHKRSFRRKPTALMKRTNSEYTVVKKNIRIHSKKKAHVSEISSEKNMEDCIVIGEKIRLKKSVTNKVYQNRKTSVSNCDLENESLKVNEVINDDVIYSHSESNNQGKVRSKYFASAEKSSLDNTKLVLVRKVKKNDEELLPDVKIKDRKALKESDAITQSSFLNQENKNWNKNVSHVSDSSIPSKSASFHETISTNEMSSNNENTALLQQILPSRKETVVKGKSEIDDDVEILSVSESKEKKTCSETQVKTQSCLSSQKNNAELDKKDNTAISKHCRQIHELVHVKSMETGITSSAHQTISIEKEVLSKSKDSNNDIEIIWHSEIKETSPLEKLHAKSESFSLCQENNESNDDPYTSIPESESIFDVMPTSFIEAMANANKSFSRTETNKSFPQNKIEIYTDVGIVAYNEAKIGESTFTSSQYYQSSPKKSEPSSKFNKKSLDPMTANIKAMENRNGLSEQICPSKNEVCKKYKESRIDDNTEIILISDAKSKKSQSIRSGQENSELNNIEIKSKNFFVDVMPTSFVENTSMSSCPQMCPIVNESLKKKVYEMETTLGNKSKIREPVKAHDESQFSLPNSRNYGLNNTFKNKKKSKYKTTDPLLSDIESDETVSSSFTKSSCDNQLINQCKATTVPSTNCENSNFILTSIQYHPKKTNRRESMDDNPTMRDSVSNDRKRERPITDRDRIHRFVDRKYKEATTSQKSYLKNHSYVRKSVIESVSSLQEISTDYHPTTPTGLFCTRKELPKTTKSIQNGLNNGSDTSVTLNIKEQYNKEHTTLTNKSPSLQNVVTNTRKPSCRSSATEKKSVDNDTDFLNLAKELISSIDKSSQLELKNFETLREIMHRTQSNRTEERISKTVPTSSENELHQKRNENVQLQKEIASNDSSTNEVIIIHEDGDELMKKNLNNKIILSSNLDTNPVIKSNFLKVSNSNPVIQTCLEKTLDNTKYTVDIRKHKKNPLESDVLRGNTRERGSQTLVDLSSPQASESSKFLQIVIDDSSDDEISIIEERLPHPVQAKKREADTELRIENIVSFNERENSFVAEEEVIILPVESNEDKCLNGELSKQVRKTVILDECLTLVKRISDECNTKQMDKVKEMVSLLSTAVGAKVSSPLADKLQEDHADLDSTTTKQCTCVSQSIKNVPRLNCRMSNRVDQVSYHPHCNHTTMNQRDSTVDNNHSNPFRSGNHINSSNHGKTSDGHTILHLCSCLCGKPSVHLESGL